MESPRKNNDCYFYYYSTCTKGDNCTFRHEPSALGCETTCQFWKEGKCINVRCNFRHMELRKNRKAIACYWESQPGGCLKPHCPFMHQNPKHPSNLENQGEGSDIKRGQDINKPAAIQNSDSCAKNLNHGTEKNFGNSVDPLVVNFEEESDNESAPSQSPVKMTRSVKVKTLEEIKLERVQAECAAYYYPAYQETEDHGDDLRAQLKNRKNKNQENQQPGSQQRKRKLIDAFETLKNDLKDLQTEDIHDTLDNIISKKQKGNTKTPDTDISQVKIKTLSEIRAERAQRLQNEVTSSESAVEASEECEVSSTCRQDGENNGIKSTVNENIAKIRPIARLKRSRVTEDEPERVKVPRLGSTPEKGEEDLDEKLGLKNCDENMEDQRVMDEERIADKEEVTEAENVVNSDKDITDEKIVSPESKDSKDSGGNLDSSKFDDVLLLDEDDFDEDNGTKAEEDIFKDIDDLLNV